MTGDLVTVIAEAGVNHNGELARAKEMVVVAAKAGADLIKFQAFRAEEIASEASPTAAYQKTNTGIDSQIELLRGLEFTMEDFAALAETCRVAGIGFLATPFDTAMTQDLVALGMDRIKVASGELTNTRALEHLASFGLPVFLSTGMSSMDEVEQAAATLKSGGSGEITLLHCTSLYPAPIDTINLKAMVSMHARTGLEIGYSDHSLGDHVAVAAVALGARVIEKHFTLDRTQPGPDHICSLEPDELAAMIAKLRDIGRALGDGVKRLSGPEEEATAALVRRSWHAVRDIKVGSVLKAGDLVLKRPAAGLAPDLSPLGRTARADLAADQPILEENLESVG